jgi:hypothetical protein
MAGMNCVRAEDAASLKGKILNYLLLDKMSTLEPVIKVDGKKADRGWIHPVTARLLCPLKYPANNEYVFIYLCFDISNFLLELIPTS